MPSNPWWEGLPGYEDAGDDTDGAAILDRFQRHMDRIEKEKQAKIKTGLNTAGVIEEWIRESTRSLEHALFTGWSSIDDQLGRPILPQEVVIIGARTGVGKTWVAQHLGEQAVLNENHRVAFISMEMSYPQLGGRFAAHALNVGPNEATAQAKAGNLTVESMLELTPGADRWWFYDHSIGVEEMPDVVMSAAEAMGAPPTIIVLDYLGLLAGKGKLYERTSENARALKEAAKETNTIIIACTQISRQVGGSGEEEPTLAGMRDSGAIEEVADRAFLFWGVQGAPNQIMCRIAKNRYGEKGEGVRLEFDHAMKLRECDLYGLEDAMSVEGHQDIPF